MNAFGGFYAEVYQKQPRLTRRYQHGTKQDSDAISAFFMKYPSFPYDPKGGVAEEFYRMCDFFAWDNDDVEREEARRGFKDAMVIQFNSLYGTDVANIENWHKLCIALYIEPLPKTIHDCKEVRSWQSSRRTLHLRMDRKSRRSMSIL